MTDDQRKEFFARAAQLGHDRAALEKQGTLTTSVTVKTPEELRKLVQPLDTAVRAQRQKDIDAAAAGKPTIQHHLESYFFGTGALDDEHQKYAQAGFPRTVDITSSLVDRTMAHGETVIGPSANPTVWNYATLNFYDDSYLTVQNTYFTLNVTNLVMQYT